MANHVHEFRAHNSPWTEMFAHQARREETTHQAMHSPSADEQAPTREALADVYNRDDQRDNTSKRF